ncbi:MAG TPA: DUF2085 domain-containing protein [Thermodesulfobacteriota bacterium]
MSVRVHIAGAAVAVSATLVIAAVAAPLLEAHRSPLASTLYGVLALVCHQRPSRSWFLMGSNLGLCVRTFTLLAAAALAGGLALWHRESRVRLARVPLGAALLLIAPLVVDGTGQLVGLWTSTNASRCATGLLAGVGLVRLALAAAAPVVARRAAAAALAAVLATTAAVPATFAAESGRVTLRGGTPVFLVFPDVVSSESVSEGQSIPLRVLRDVKVDGRVVIAAGARATARVTKVQPRSGWGTPGRLEVYVSDVEAVDGQLIPLSARQEAEGRDSGSTAAVTGIVLGVLCLPSALWGFAIKGDEGRIPPGAEVKAFTEGEAYVEVARRDS